MLEDKNFSAFADRLKIKFNDLNLLQQAFIHRSYLNENRQLKLSHNERLEFLGDAVLELVVTDYLYHQYPDKTEGEMTAYRAALVNTNTLSTVATELGMNEYLLLSKGEAKDAGRARQYILANTFESVIGAIYLDQGYQAAADFIHQHLLVRTEAMIKQNLWQDPKSLFQERAQEATGITPSYRVLDETGPDHDKWFTVGLFLDEEQVATGEGHSKQEAEQKAALAGLANRGWNNG